MTYNQTETGIRLKAARKFMGYSLEKVAELCGVQQYQTISSWESGNSTPSIEKLVKLAELYGCEVGYFVGEYDCKYRKNADIKSVTGLSESSIDIIKRDKFFDEKNIHSLDKMITFNNGDILALIGKYLYHNYKGSVEIGDIEINGDTVADTILLEILCELRELRKKVQGGNQNG